MKRHKRDKREVKKPHRITIRSDILKEIDTERPTVRSECYKMKRPCPWVMCRYHMVWFLFDSNLGQAIHCTDRPMKYDPLRKHTDAQVVNEIMNMQESCILDIADRRGCTLEEIGLYAGVSRERIRQLEYYYKTNKATGEITQHGAMVKMKHPSRSRRLAQFLEGL